MAANVDRAYPSTTPVPTIAIRKPRLDGAGAWASRPGFDNLQLKLSCMGGSAHSCRRQLDRLADAEIGHAAAEIASHSCIDVLIGRIGIVIEQGGCLHDLSRLAVAALRDLQLDPGSLQRMPALR